MPLLKSLVIGLGVLILLGMTLLVYGFYQKANNPGWRMFSSPRADGPAAPAAAFGELDLKLPDGCVIGRLTPDGDRAYIKVRPDGAKRGPPMGGPCNLIVVIDVVRGRVLGTIKPGP
ncbi:MAG: hypothetical protein IH994_03385 [Proteobacteria bacterium]|nr:hypothetical protein [Pseudomonadota bacterium]